MQGMFFVLLLLLLLLLLFVFGLVGRVGVVLLSHCVKYWFVEYPSTPEIEQTNGAI